MKIQEDPFAGSRDRDFMARRGATRRVASSESFPAAFADDYPQSLKSLIARSIVIRIKMRHRWREIGAMISRRTIQFDRFIIIYIVLYIS